MMMADHRLHCGVSAPGYMQKTEAGLPEVGAIRLMDHAKEWRRKQWKQLDGPQGQTDKEQGQD